MEPSEKPPHGPVEELVTAVSWLDAIIVAVVALVALVWFRPLDVVIGGLVLAVVVWAVRP